MLKPGLLSQMEFARARTLGMLDEIAKETNAQEILGWRPGPGRAHIAWQIMHLAATDDRHLNVLIKQRKVHRPDYVERFAGGSTVDDIIPTLSEIQEYLNPGRAALLEYFRSVEDTHFPRKPHEEARWTHQEWLQVLCWHEAHHQGQAHITWNLFKVARES